MRGVEDKPPLRVAGADEADARVEEKLPRARASRGRPQARRVSRSRGRGDIRPLAAGISELMKPDYRQFLITSGTMPSIVSIWPVAMPFESKADTV